MDQADRLAIADRVRALVGRRAVNETAAVARELGVADVALRGMLEAASPGPSVDVLAAIVRTCGIDPNWLLTGEYDGSTHARALDGDRSTIVGELIAVARRRGIRLDRPEADRALGVDRSV